VLLNKEADRSFLYSSLRLTIDIYWSCRR